MPFHSLLKESGIQHERAPSHTPRYNQVMVVGACYASRPPPAVRHVMESNNNPLRTEAIQCLNDMQNRCCHHLHRPGRISEH